jgi:hypothetical protein
MLDPFTTRSAAAAVLLLVLTTASSCRASEGDESQLFQACMQSCLSTGCTKTPGSSNTCDTVCEHRSEEQQQGGSSGSSYHPPWTLRLMRWDCESDCSYHCMWALEAPKQAAAAAAGSVYKYYGKWPFVRVAGAQEIASVVFSIANLLAHLHNLQLFLRLVRRQQSGGSRRSTAGGSSGPAVQQQQQYPYTRLWVANAGVNINAWLWSSVFHCRDTRLTERLDYFSADLVVAVGCGVVVARALQLTSARHLVMLCLVLGAALLQHMHYMAFVKFDYGYNMSLCIAFGIATAAAWLLWATRGRHPGRWTLYRFMALVHLAMLLEVLDFPPFLQLFDAHALWHAATVPLTYLWYRFVAADVAAWQGGQQQGGGGGQQQQQHAGWDGERGGGDGSKQKK